MTHPAPVTAGDRLRESYAYDGVATTNNPIDPSFSGLWVQEWGNALMSGPPDWEELHSNLHWNWGAGSPTHITGSADYWSVRLTGYLNVPDFAGDGSATNVKFRIYSNDGSALTIGSKTLSDCFGAVQDMPTYNCTSNVDAHMMLSPGPRAFTFEFSELTGNADFDIQWSHGGSAWVTIPAQYLTPDLGLVTTTTSSKVSGSTVTDLSQNVQTFNDPAGGDGYKARRLGDSATTLSIPAGVSLAKNDVYDSFGRLVSETKAPGTPLASTTTYAYTDSASAGTTCLTTTTDALGAVSTQTCDQAGNVTSSTQQIRAVAGQSAQSRTTTSTFDSLGRALTIDPPGPSFQNMSYDLAGRPLETQQLVAASPQTFACTDNVYDDAGQLIQQTAPDPDGNCGLADATPNDRPITKFTWSWADNQLTRTDP